MKSCTGNLNIFKSTIRSVWQEKIEGGEKAATADTDP